MAGLLAANGYKLTDDKFDAQLWLLNSCTVKNPAEDHFKLVLLYFFINKITIIINNIGQ